MFLETEPAFPYCNWSIKMDRIIWVGSTSVDIGQAYVNNWQRLGRLPFRVYVKSGNSLKQKHILSSASKRKISARKLKKKTKKIYGCKYDLHQFWRQAQQYLVTLVRNIHFLLQKIGQCNIIWYFFYFLFFFWGLMGTTQRPRYTPYLKWEYAQGPRTWKLKRPFFICYQWYYITVGFLGLLGKSQRAVVHFA